MEIVVVSGLPRSGTSLMMSALEAGGVELLTDGVRGADVDNPRGYFEVEQMKTLDADAGWLAGARGKAVKIISHWLDRLPPEHRYRVLFMRRDLGEVLESQARMLVHRGGPRPAPDPELAAELKRHLEATARLLRERACFEFLDVRHRALVQRPRAELERVARFLGRELDVAAMCARVDPALYRVRGSDGGEFL